MSIPRPFKRTCRQLTDGSYSHNGHWQYLLHKDFVTDPQHYIRAFLILQKDLIHLFEYLEPCDQNLPAISFRIHELLMRACIEIEANFTAILKENIFSKKGNLTIKDYQIIDHSHRLSAYEAALPLWLGNRRTRHPFAAWQSGGTLTWYQAYNKSKHDRHGNFSKATFDHLLDAMGALVILLSAQFHDEEYSPNDKGLSIGYAYDTGDKMETGVGGYFRIKFPKDWPLEERYGFDWQQLKIEADPIAQFDYDQLLLKINNPT
jgi:hypothetical protein